MGLMRNANNGEVDSSEGLFNCLNNTTCVLELLAWSSQKTGAELYAHIVTLRATCLHFGVLGAALSGDAASLSNDILTNICFNQAKARDDLFRFNQVNIPQGHCPNSKNLNLSLLDNAVTASMLLIEPELKFKRDPCKMQTDLSGTLSLPCLVAPVNAGCWKITCARITACICR